MTPAPNSVLLDCADGGANDLLLFGQPREIIQTSNPLELSRTFARLEQARAAGFHLAGWFSYELGYLIQPHQRPLYEHNFRLGLPLFWFGVFDPPQRLPRSVFSATTRAYAGPLSWECNAK